MDYMVSSHGGFEAGTPNIILPDNITVKFFVADGAVLSNDRTQNVNGWSLYSHLILGAEGINEAYINGKVVQTFFGGASVKNYRCWPMTEPGLADYSGIYQLGTRARFNDMAHINNLQDVITLVGHATPTTIYWVACRSAV